MRGADFSQPSLFVMKSVGDFVPVDHPLRALRELVDEALTALDPLFDEMYADYGRASIAPERLIRASLLQIIYTLRSERQLVEHIHFNMRGVSLVCRSRLLSDLKVGYLNVTWCQLMRLWGRI